MKPGKLTLYVLDNGGGRGATSIWVPLANEVSGRDGFIAAVSMLTDGVVIGWEYSYGETFDVAGAGDIRQGGILYYDNAVDVTAVSIPGLLDEFYFHQSGHTYDGLIIDTEPVILSYLTSGGLIVSEKGDLIGQFVIGALLK